MIKIKRRKVQSIINLVNKIPIMDSIRNSRIIY